MHTAGISPKDLVCLLTYACTQCLCSRGAFLPTNVFSRDSAGPALFTTPRLNTFAHCIPQLLPVAYKQISDMLNENANWHVCNVIDAASTSRHAIEFFLLLPAMHALLGFTVSLSVWWRAPIPSRATTTSLRQVSLLSAVRGTKRDQPHPTLIAQKKMPLHCLPCKAV